MPNADSAKIGGTNGAVGPLLMKKIIPATIELKDIVADEKEIYKKIYFQGFGERIKKLSFRLKSGLQEN